MLNRIKIQLQFQRYRYKCSLGHTFIKDDNKQKYTCPQCNQELGEGWYRDVGDTIYLTQDEYSTIKVEDLDAKIQERVDKNIYNIENSPPYIEPTLDGLQLEINMKLQEIENLELRKIEAQAKIDAKVIEEK